MFLALFRRWNSKLAFLAEVNKYIVLYIIFKEFNNHTCAGVGFCFFFFAVAIAVVKCLRARLLLIPSCMLCPTLPIDNNGVDCMFVRSQLQRSVHSLRSNCTALCSEVIYTDQVFARDLSAYLSNKIMQQICVDIS